MVATKGAAELLADIDKGDFTVTAKDGVRYVLRHICDDDAESLMRGYDAMSERAKWFRMMNALPHLTPEQAARFCDPDPSDEICLVFEGGALVPGEILGGARIAREGTSTWAEFSVSLRPEAHGKGLARKALETVIHLAPTIGCNKVFGIISRKNAPMIALAERIGFEIMPDPDDVSLVRAEIDVNSAALRPWHG